LGLSYGIRPKESIPHFILSEGLIRWISFSSLALCLVIFSSVFLFPAVSHPAEVTIAWSPSTDAKVAGYTVHYGPPGQDSEFQVNAGKETKIISKHLPPFVCASPKDALYKSIFSHLPPPPKRGDRPVESMEANWIFF